MDQTVFDLTINPSQSTTMAFPSATHTCYQINANSRQGRSRPSAEACSGRDDMYSSPNMRTHVVCKMSNKACPGNKSDYLPRIINH